MRPGPKTNPYLGPLKRATVLIDDLTIEMLRVVGDGNLSEGVRRAARTAYDLYQATTDAPKAKA